VKLVAVYTPSHERLLDEWFRPSMQDDYELLLHRLDAGSGGGYRTPDWTAAVLQKSRCIIDAIRNNLGEIIVYSDVDVQFFAPTREHIRNAMYDRDIACQLDAPNGQLCTGFFAVRANDATLALWQEVERCVAREGRDQSAFNRIVRARDDIRIGCLPLEFFGAGTFYRRKWRPGDRLYVHPRRVMFHANWTVGIENKLKLMEQARRIADGGRAAIAANNALFRIRYGAGGLHAARLEVAARNATPEPASWPVTRPFRVSLDASTICQLKCPSCPTATGAVAAGIGAGSLSLHNFSRFVREHPWVTDIELSNWGEILLNRELPKILEYAYEHAVTVRAANGVNLNSASDAVLESLVKYRLRRLSCSIDGASQRTYSLYRRNGRYDRVIANIGKINEYKKKYRSPYPELSWQFVVFGHNEHEITAARRLARRLNMRFKVKLSWDDLYTEPYSPVVDRDLVRREAGAADRQEYRRRRGRSYLAGVCSQLWDRPRINYDGRLLGCSINHWGDFGNVFADGLEACLEGEKVAYAGAMLSGRAEQRPDIPCSSCKVYRDMREENAWLDPPTRFEASPIGSGTGDHRCVTPRVPSQERMR
jgi:MoaA/NifB/PqqE/SkfB family radical SAM enzyme